MAGASTRSQAVSTQRPAGWRTLLDWTAMPHRLAARASRRGRFVPEERHASDADPIHPVAADATGFLPPSPAFPLLSAYARSAIEITQQAASLEPTDGLRLGPVAVQALVSRVVHELDPLARQGRLVLLRDADSRCDGVCCAEPARLRTVFRHLLLRALSMEQAPGHVRIMVTLIGHEARIAILSRTPEATLAAHAEAARQDLIAPQRLLQSMGGSLVLEPRRAGYLPLCIAVPALSAVPARRVA